MQPFVTLFQGWIHVRTGPLEQGIEDLRRGVAEWSHNFIVLRPHWKGYLAEALARAGHVQEGLDTLDEALQQVERTGEGFAEAELHRLKGELLRQKGAPDADAEAQFQGAMEIARRQKAKSWELRATISLAKLLQAQGRPAEAREMLAAIYSWFTEGFDTPDLQEAKALLAELRGSAVRRGSYCQGGNPMTEVLALEHAAIHVSDIEKSRHFYQDLLGLDVVTYVEHEGGAIAELCAIEGTYLKEYRMRPPKGPGPAGKAPGFTLDLLQIARPAGQFGGPRSMMPPWLTLLLG